MKLHFREAVISDAERILPLWIQLMERHAEESIIFKPVPDFKDRIIEDIRRLISQPDTTIFLAEMEGKLAGYSMVSRSSRPAVFIKNKKAYIGDTLIDPSLRSKGVGSGLVKYILNWLRERGVEYVDLQVTISNEEGRRFWEKCGFNTVNYYMVREIGKE